MESPSLNRQTRLRNQLAGVFRDYNVRQLFLKQLFQIPQHHYRISFEFDKIYIEIRDHPPSPQDQKRQQDIGSSLINYDKVEMNPSQIASFNRTRTRSLIETMTSLKLNYTYLIRVTKQFPINGVRLYVQSGQVQPQVFDSRDMLLDCIGQKWKFTHKLSDIYQKLYKVDQKLQMRTDSPLSIQKTGQFQMLDQFYVDQFAKFPSLDIFVNLNKDSKSFIVLGVCQTHLLIFKEDVKLVKKGSFSSNGSLVGQFGTRKVFLSRYCDLQCISDIEYNRETCTILVTVCKYKSIKTFNQFEPMTRKYVLEEPEIFLRSILKNIIRFQQLRMSFFPREVEDDDLQVIERVRSTQVEEQRLFTSHNGKILTTQERQKIVQHLQKNYRTLIQYYSSKALSYYLIYVNKINFLYTKFMLPPQ